jgi:hypothetical protein
MRGGGCAGNGSLRVSSSSHLPVGRRQMNIDRHWLRSKSVVAQAYHPCSSLLIRVHLRFHFLLPEQARNRREAPS